MCPRSSFVQTADHLILRLLPPSPSGRASEIGDDAPAGDPKFRSRLRDRLAPGPTAIPKPLPCPSKKSFVGGPSLGCWGLPVSKRCPHPCPGGQLSASNWNSSSVATHTLKLDTHPFRDINFPALFITPPQALPMKVHFRPFPPVNGSDSFLYYGCGFILLRAIGCVFGFAVESAHPIFLNVFAVFFSTSRPIPTSSSQSHALSRQALENNDTLTVPLGTGSPRLHS